MAHNYLLGPFGYDTSSGSATGDILRQSSDAFQFKFMSSESYYGVDSAGNRKLSVESSAPALGLADNMPIYWGSDGSFAIGDEDVKLDRASAGVFRVSVNGGSGMTAVGTVGTDGFNAITGATKNAVLSIANGLLLASNRTIKWSSTTDATGSADVSLQRGATGAGRLELTAAGGSPVFSVHRITGTGLGIETTKNELNIYNATGAGQLVCNIGTLQNRVQLGNGFNLSWNNDTDINGSSLDAMIGRSGAAELSFYLGPSVTQSVIFASSGTNNNTCIQALVNIGGVQTMKRIVRDAGTGVLSMP